MENVIHFKAPKNSAFLKSVMYSTLKKTKHQNDEYSVNYNGVGKETLILLIERNGGKIIAK